MRDQGETKRPGWINKGSKRNPDYRGRVFYRGRMRRLGPVANGGKPIDSVERWNELERVFRGRVDAELDQPAGQRDLPATLPTLAEWCGMRTKSARGTITSDWPAKWPRKKRRAVNAIKAAEEGSRPLLRDWGEYRPNEITWVEADSWLGDQATNARTYAPQMVDDYIRDHRHLWPVGLANPFRGHPDLADRPGGRVSGEHHVVTSDEQFEALLDAALHYRADDHRLVAHALVLAMGTSCCRVGELMALRWSPTEPIEAPYARGTIDLKPSYVDFERDRIWIGSQILDDGSEGPVKNDDRGWIVLPPVLKETLLTLPRVSEYVFPGPSGKRMKGGQWTGSYWSIVRQAAGLPDLQFYELKHRAITWICTPKDPSGAGPSGLGLDPITAAVQARHKDGGLTIIEHYLRLDANAALDRIQHAMTSEHAVAPALPSSDRLGAADHLRLALDCDLPAPVRDMVVGALAFLQSQRAA